MNTLHFLLLDVFQSVYTLRRCHDRCLITKHSCSARETGFLTDALIAVNYDSSRLLCHVTWYICLCHVVYLSLTVLYGCGLSTTYYYCVKLHV